MSHAVEMYRGCSAYLRKSCISECTGSAIFAFESGGFHGASNQALCLLKRPNSSPAWACLCKSSHAEYWPCRKRAAPLARDPGMPMPMAQVPILTWKYQFNDARWF
eukprot:1158924-Pelagomonas_calceolata.AAC.13